MRPVAVDAAGADATAGDLNRRARRVLDDARRCAEAAAEVHDRLGRLRGEMTTNLRTGNAEIERARAFLVTAGNEQRHAQESFLAMGRVAGSVAHDLNNLLTVILSYGSAALRRAQDDPPARDDLLHIARAAQHAAILTRQILREGRVRRAPPSEWAVVDVDEIVEANRPMLGRLLGTVALQTGLGGLGGYVRAHAGEIEQVLFNLVVNARDAMRGEGSVTVETARVERFAASTEEDIPERLVPCVMLAVHDTGAGMDEETLAQVFEPFFTTKDADTGTGLGLATVLRIARGSGAQVEMESGPGRGCSVRLFFPRVDAQEADAPEGDAAGLALAHGTILLVEDDSMVRRAIEISLDALGYSVIAKDGAAEALDVLARGDQHVDLILTDIEMPAMSGRQLATLAQSLRPGIKVLFVSGLGGSALAGSRDESGTPLLEKPFTSAALANRVREALSTPTH